MKIIHAPLKGIYILEPEPQIDSRGFFMRAFDTSDLAKQNFPFEIVQVNLSFTKQKGTLRGLHFQKYPKAEKKIVQCIQGEIYDVVVNINPESKDYGKHFSIQLSENNQKLLCISEDFAHGFQTVKDNCLVQYFMDEFYAPETATGVAWNDPFFNIQWPIAKPRLSDKDSRWEFIKL